jgi:uncharacterized protein with PQ loop repeat
MFYSAIGYFGLALNLYSMSLKGEFKLRLFSLFANFVYVIYGVLIDAYPIIIGGTIAVLLHMIRIKKMNYGRNQKS